MQDVFVGKGHGYEKSDRGRCTAFDDYEIIAEPMGGFDQAGRDSRCGGVFMCDYQSHMIKLAVRKGGVIPSRSDELYILMHHGGGREVLHIPTFYDRGAFRETLLAMPEPVMYATLYTIYQTASQARDQAQKETSRKWGEAFLDNRIRRKRSRGRVTVSVETPFERDLRTGKAKPSAIAIDVATGEITPVDEPQAA